MILHLILVLLAGFSFAVMLGQTSEILTGRRSPTDFNLQSVLVWMYGTGMIIAICVDPRGVF